MPQLLPSVDVIILHTGMVGDISHRGILLLPATNSDSLRGSDRLTLQAVNKSVIKTYGQKWMTLDLRLKREFGWFFVIADIDKTDFRC